MDGLGFPKSTRLLWSSLGQRTGPSPHHAAMLALGIPGARMVQVAGAGHFLICSHPEELVQIIESWFADTDDVAPL